MIRKKLLALVLILSVACGLWACAPNSLPSMKRYSASFSGSFDTVTQVVAYAESQEAFDEMRKAIEADLLDYHRLFDIYNEYPGLLNLKSLNEQAGKGSVKLDAKIIDLLQFGREAWTLSAGKVNIAMGAVLRLWHDAREQSIADPAQAYIPSRKALETAAQHGSMDDLIIDASAGTVELKDAQMSLDVGAIAKGYAVEQIARKLEKEGAQHVLISCGGNVRAVGSKLDGKPWRIAIEDPDEASDSYACRVDVTDKAVVTSGVYERNFMYHGKSYHHIIDPSRLEPLTRYLSVSIVSEDSAMADVLSTALFNLELEEAKALVAKMPAVEVYWILPDKSVEMTEGFKKYLVP